MCACCVVTHTHTHTHTRERERKRGAEPAAEGRRERERSDVQYTLSNTPEKKKIEREEAHFEIHFVSVRIKSCT